LFSPKSRRLAGRIGAYRLHATHDPRETTEKARAAFLASFVDEVDPNRVLPEPERLRRATAARKAHFATLAYLSARKRAMKKAASSPKLTAKEVQRDGAITSTP
jgi:hypothetical protein